MRARCVYIENLVRSTIGLHFKYSVCLLGFILSSYFWQNSNAQTTTFTINANTILISNTPIDSSSLRVYFTGKPLQIGKDYVLLPNRTQIKFCDSNLGKTVNVHFMAINPLVFEPYLKNKLSTKGAGNIEPTTPVYTQNFNNQSSNVKTLGLLSRGISFGNSQDLVLNSNLNLRITGELSNDFFVEGAITDQEFPFQPEGTTSSLQDFDRIYMKFYNKKHAITLGDHQLINSNEFSFIKLNKKNRGLLWQFQSAEKKPKHSGQVDAALARGRFSRNDFQGIEGLQGPYRLSGARNEQFIIVISGTEQVFLDGKKMQRGLQEDYIIDYNLGEITFTPKQIINAFSRIVVEFQYSDRFYTRTITSANYVFNLPKFKAFAAVYSENDIKSQPIQQDLDLFDSSKMLSATQILQAAGDNLLNSSISGVKASSEFNYNQPNYIRIDTGAVPFYYYVSQAQSFSKFYTLNFSYVGPGRGNYILDGTVANGKVYRYTPPISGLPAGFYEPIVQIVAPTAIQMAETGLQYNLSPSSTIYSTFSGSRQDLNTFSSFCDTDNLGYAFKTVINTKLKSKDTSKHWLWQHSLSTDYSSANFKSIERFRDVEASREWSKTINNENYQSTQTKILSLQYSNVFSIPKIVNWQSKVAQYRVNALNTNDLQSNFTYYYRNWYLNPTAQINQSSNNRFHQSMQTIGYKKSTMHHTAHYWTEKSLFTNAFGPLSTSYKFNQMQLSTQFVLAKTQIIAQATQRLMFNTMPMLALSKSNSAQNYSISATKSAKKSALMFNLNYRQSKLLDTVYKNLYATENHISSRIEYNYYSALSPFKFNTYYQTISGREQQRQYAYFEVPAGQGFYAWQDYNSNGIREINEFVESPFPDQARYVRLLIPTAQYINSQGSELYGNWQYRRLEKSTINLWRINTTYNLNAKTIEANVIRKMLPFTSGLADTNTLQAQYYLRNQVEFENVKRNLFLQQTSQYRASKLLLTNGFDTKVAQSAQFLQRYSPSAVWQLSLEEQWAKHNYQSQINANYNYQYSAPAVQTSLTWQPSQRFKITGQSQNTWYVSSTQSIATQWQAKLSVAKSIGMGGLANMEFNYIRNTYLGAQNTPLAFDILQGFTTGNNIRGIANIRFNPSRNIQVISGYELRRSQTSKAIHIGRMEIRYLF